MRGDEIAVHQDALGPGHCDPVTVDRRMPEVDEPGAATARHVQPIERGAKARALENLP
jgi:hypothetical protein